MRIQIIGPLEGYGTEAAKMAMDKGAQVFSCISIEESLSNLRQNSNCDLVLVDVSLDIKSFIKSLKEERFYLDVVGCGVKPDPKKAAAAIRAGAKEYIPLPPDPQMIAALLQSISPPPEQSIIANDPTIKRVLHLADRVAPSEANILLTGKSGTGKEVLANYIHQKSKRHKNPFIAINCAAIPDNLLESELFGHEKGAFTGALTQRIGKFESANGGTLLLDEITEMPLQMQAKLLRAIQEKIIDRVGGTKPVSVNIRILATSNRDMLAAVKGGNFREDLYYRLNVVNLALPTLKERPADIIPLAKYFIQKYAKINQLYVKELSITAEQALLKWPWNGNVRELENLMHRSVLLADDKIQPTDIFGYEYCQTTHSTINDNSQIETNGLIGKSIQDVEKELILQTLDHCTGRKNNAAEILGISIRTLQNKLKEYEQNTSL
ncbi:MAG: sigma-54-dependent Fis family transcriptional regulator [Alphaproteobacteria bacterium CG_4_10_14_0_8_um_filter_37_21]|nr:MAG: sigma-54-dependent Fis family transcriptional regulator [Alphaproteobacteria bacterium CG_4_10_14_0_8_um_filter_37_21]